ncbi:hypothetical protein ES754_05370 [Psychrobacter frigidicola]|uniref:Uncharacterized protein n=1 Tax=Psychrobacter frigidicola TaxID=45611 RepID=A0A5C7A6N1_9GAMM|nr:hypothetical protein [Psychrobacter frigidicola]TXD98350.1 hypothetical protein ES754_05370 [Psychrobacter frigidicola]
MKKTALYVLIGIGLLGCGSDDSRPGVMPGLPPGGTVQPTPPNQGGSTPNQPPTDSSTPPPGPGNTNEGSTSESLAGIYTGTTGRNQTVKGIIDQDNNIWFVYGDNADLDINTGFINANLKAVNSEINGEGRDYASIDDSADKVTIKGSYQNKVMLSGTLIPEGSKISDSYSLSYNNQLSSPQQSLARIANKTFNGNVYISKGGVDSARITVNSDGSFSGSSVEGCKVSGDLSFPQKNTKSAMYFVSTVRLGNAPCYPANQIFKGVGHLDATNELIVVGIDDNKRRGLIFGGQGS